MRKFNHIARAVRSARETCPMKYSQSELSHLLGYKNGQFISNVERGKCSLPLKGLNKFCIILKIDPENIKQAILLDMNDSIDLYLPKEIPCP